MPTMSHTPAVATALTAACDALLAMIENDHALLAVGEFLMMALLREATDKQLCNVIIIRRLHSRLVFLKRIVEGLAQTTAPRGPRCG
jgi:hypothetical protein